MVFGCVPLCYFLSFVAFLAAQPAASRIWKKAKNPLVFVGRKPYAPFSRNTRIEQFSEDRRSKNRSQNSSKNNPQGSMKHDPKMIIFEAKMPPKMDPGGLEKRVRKTVGN